MPDVILLWSPVVDQVPSANFWLEERVLAGRIIKFQVRKQSSRMVETPNFRPDYQLPPWPGKILIFSFGGLREPHIMVYI